MSHGFGKSAGLEPAPGCCGSSHQRPVLWAQRSCTHTAWCSLLGFLCSPHLQRHFPRLLWDHTVTTCHCCRCPHTLDLGCVPSAVTPRESAHPQQFPNTFSRDFYKSLSLHKTGTDPEPPWSTAAATTSTSSQIGKGLLPTDKLSPELLCNCQIKEQILKVTFKTTVFILLNHLYMSQDKHLRAKAWSWLQSEN